MSDHVHDMRPARSGAIEVYTCTSCLFSCTRRALATVKANPGQHQLVRRGHPQASLIWDLPKSKRSPS